MYGLILFRNAGCYLFADFHKGYPENGETERYPLARPKTVTIKNLHTVSEMPVKLCKNEALFKDTELIIQ